MMPSHGSFATPVEMSAFAERSFEQVKLAFDKFIDATHSTMTAFEGQSKVAQALPRTWGRGGDRGENPLHLVDPAFEPICGSFTSKPCARVQPAKPPDMLSLNQ